MTATTFVPPERSDAPVRIDLMSRLAAFRPGARRRKFGPPSVRTTSQRTPKHLAGLR